MKTQGTDLYAIDPDDGSLIVVGCPTAIDGIDTTVEQLETTCLGSAARTYEAGLATPGTASFTINVDPKDPSHARLHQLKVAGKSLLWAVGWSEDPQKDRKSAQTATAIMCLTRFPPVAVGLFLKAL